MKIEKTYSCEITEEDYKLLTGYIPENPCIGCYNRQFCCGCPEEQKYKEILKPFEAANLIEIVSDVNNLKSILQKIDDLEQKSIELQKSLIQKGFDLTRLFNNKYLKLLQKSETSEESMKMF